MSSKKGGKRGKTGLGLTVGKNEDFARWYPEVITKSEMIEYYPDVSGCYILRPWSFRIWEHVQSWFDAEIKELGVEPCYFPLFVSKKALETEEDHIDDFAPEVAWVTRSGNTELENPIAIRPTSETIMYPSFAKWVHGHRDLPLRLNQWCNSVRWEFKNPTPFLRTREFLWQEGHTAFATQAEADVEVLQILDLYARVYEELLAMPVIKGRKSDKEKFAGGDYTTTVEAFIPAAGRAIQGATSHSLGQNFAKMFKITFEDEKGEKDNLVWQNSWGLTTRVIGVMVMVHGDDKGLVLPPRVAPLQLVGIGITASKTPPEDISRVRDKVAELCALLKKAGTRTKCDNRTDKNPGWKFAHWEQKGVPLRLEVGPRDLEASQCVLVRRDTGAKTICLWDAVAETVPALLLTIQQDMLDKARKERDERVSIVWTWEEFVVELGKGNLILAPWCLTIDSEEWVKEETKKLGAEAKKVGGGAEAAEETNAEGESKQLTGAAKTLCIPFNQPDLPAGTKCFTGNGKDAESWCLWGRSY